MTREDILRMGIETDLFIYNGDDTSLTVWLIPTEEKFLKFASLVAAEKEQQMIRDGWRQCAEGQRTTQFCGLLDAAARAEREACAKVCEEQIKSYMSKKYTTDPLGGFRERFAAEQCAAAIRARGEA